MEAFLAIVSVILGCVALSNGAGYQEKIWKTTLVEKCSQGTNVSEMVVAECKDCIANFSLPEKLTRAEARLVKQNCIPKSHPRDIVKEKCKQTSLNQTQLESCLKCVDDYKLSEIALRGEVSGMKRSCLPKLSAKEKATKKCLERATNENQATLCIKCVEDYKLPVNATRGEVSHMKSLCLPKIDPKTKAGRKCLNKLDTMADVEKCQECILSYKLPEKASCDEIKDMEKYCIFTAFRKSRNEDDNLPFDDGDFDNEVED